MTVGKCGAQAHSFVVCKACVGECEFTVELGDELLGACCRIEAEYLAPTFAAHILSRDERLTFEDEHLTVRQARDGGDAVYVAAAGVCGLWRFHFVCNFL